MAVCCPCRILSGLISSLGLYWPSDRVKRWAFQTCYVMHPCTKLMHNIILNMCTLTLKNLQVHDIRKCLIWCSLTDSLLQIWNFIVISWVSISSIQYKCSLFVHLNEEVCILNFVFVTMRYFFFLFKEIFPLIGLFSVFCGFISQCEKMCGKETNLLCYCDWSVHNMGCCPVQLLPAWFCTCLVL